MNILRKRDHQSLLRSQLISLNGHGDITQACQAFPEKVSAFRLVGIYDGDAYDEVMKLEPKWPLAFLPGNQPVEAIFKEMAETNVGSIARRLGRTESQLAVILGKLRGHEYHDWFEEFVKELHVSFSELMHVCYEEWIEDVWVQAHVDNFLKDLEKALG